MFAVCAPNVIRLVKVRFRSRTGSKTCGNRSPGGRFLVSDASIEADGIAAFTSVVCSPDVLDTGEGLPHPMSTARDRPPEEAAEDTSFARGLRVLLTIADRGEIRADDLGTALDMSMSTVYRYLRTLTEFGFIERHEGGYGLGPRLLIGTGANVSSEEL